MPPRRGNVIRLCASPVKRVLAFFVAPHHGRVALLRPRFAPIQGPKEPAGFGRLPWCKCFQAGCRPLRAQTSFCECYHLTPSHETTSLSMPGEMHTVCLVAIDSRAIQPLCPSVTFRPCPPALCAKALAPLAGTLLPLQNMSGHVSYWRCRRN